MVLKTSLRSLIRRTLGDYALYWLYSCNLAGGTGPDLPSGVVAGPLERSDQLANAPHPELMNLAKYSGPESIGFAAWVGGELAAACWYWHGERYRQRGFIDLRVGEAKLVQVTVAAPFRGRGLAPALIRYSAARMKELGFGTLHARIWHSNHASIRAFRCAGWTRSGFIADVHPFGRAARTRLHLRLPARRAA